MEKETEEEITYLRKNGESTTDPDIIEQCKLEQNRDIIENTRLGSYDKFGNYIFLPEIRHELINIPKFIYHFELQSDKKVYDLKTPIPLYGELFFRLTISSKEIVLYLVETVSRESGAYIEVYEEMVEAVAVGEQKSYSLEEIFKMFKVFKNDTDEDMKIFFIYDYINILIRKIYLSLLSRELILEMQVDEHEIFNTMIAILKDGGKYGQRVLNVFTTRLKERPEIFEIENTEKYNKAVNEVLLSALDIATKAEDKENFQTKEIYLKVLNARNKNVDKHIENAHKNIEKDYVKDVAKRSINVFNESKKKEENLILRPELDEEKQKNREIIQEFYDKLIGKKPSERTILEKSILKHGKEEVKATSSASTIVASDIGASLHATNKPATVTPKVDVKKQENAPLVQNKVNSNKKLASNTNKKDKGKGKGKVQNSAQGNSPKIQKQEVKIIPAKPNKPNQDTIQKANTRPRAQNISPVENLQKPQSLVPDAFPFVGKSAVGVVSISPTHDFASNDSIKPITKTTEINTKIATMSQESQKSATAKPQDQTKSTAEKSQDDKNELDLIKQKNNPFVRGMQGVNEQEIERDEKFQDFT